MFTIPTRLSQLFWQSHYSNIFWSTIPTQYYSDRTVWGGCSKLRHYSNMFTIPTFSSILFWQIIISTIPRTIPWTPKCGNLPCVAASYCARSAPRKFWLYWSAFTIPTLILDTIPTVSLFLHFLYNYSDRILFWRAREARPRKMWYYFDKYTILTQRSWLFWQVDNSYIFFTTILTILHSLLFWQLLVLKGGLIVLYPW